MTTLLLDTHAFFCAAADPGRLGDRARSLIEDPANDLLVSAASAWELSTKVRLGRFPEAEQLVLVYDATLEALGATDLAVRSAHSLRAGMLRWDHRDPFDRMIAAQAMVEHLVLVTRDHVFYELAGIDVAW